MGLSETAIDVIVGVGICGNAVIEGSEDCEGTDLGGQSCVGLGFSDGELTCDISCSFDVSACLPPVAATPASGNVPATGRGGWFRFVDDPPAPFYSFSSPSAAVPKESSRTVSSGASPARVQVLFGDRAIVAEESNSSVALAAPQDEATTSGSWIGVSAFLLILLIILIIVIVFIRRRSDADQV